MDITLIKDLRVGAKNVQLLFIVLEVSQRASTTKEGIEVRTVKIADRSGSINLSVWGDQGASLQPGDICRITKGYVANWKGIPTFYVAKGGDLLKTGEFCFIFNETPNMSDQNQYTQVISKEEVEQQAS